MPKTISKDRREAIITPRAGKWKIDFYLTFPDDPKHKELVGGDLMMSETSADRRAHAWVNGGET